MAPNNALRSREAETTVLDAGTVEARGTGSRCSDEKIQAEISHFLQGEGKLSVRAESRSFFTVLTFITRLPGPTWTDHHPGYLMRGMAYFPLVGCLVGVFVSIHHAFAIHTLHLPPMVAACFSTAAGFWLTGCFHEDGLADSADGIGGGWSRSQILKIMTDTRLGTYGCAVLTLYLLAKVSLLAQCEPSDIIVVQMVARLVAPFAIANNNYVDETGPKYQYYSFMVSARSLVSWHRVSFATMTCVLVASIIIGTPASCGLTAVSLLVSHIAGRYASYLLGGVMGDFLGATICCAEIVLLALLVSIRRDNFIHWINFQKTKLPDLVHEALNSLCKRVSEPDLAMKACMSYIGLILFTLFWSSNVGHPSVFVRDEVIKRLEAEDPGETTSTNPKFPQNSAFLGTERICNSSESFSARYEAARSYIDGLAKPMGSLGTIEDWAARLAALQKTMRASPGPVASLIFAADHGVAMSLSEGGEECSAFPASVTRSVLHGLDRGIGGASVMAAASNVAWFRVIDVGVKDALFDSETVESTKDKLETGTKNFCVQPAMTLEIVDCMLQIGRSYLTKAVKESNANVIVIGEVGIGNTTSSSSLIAAITGECPRNVCGHGATIGRQGDPAVVARKVEIVERALALHQAVQSPKEALRVFGGAEIAAMVGCMLEASEQGKAIMVDGFIATSAALVAVSMNPACAQALFLSTKSTEVGQVAALRQIHAIAGEHDDVVPPAPPALDMSLRMGEGTGALLAVPLLNAAANILTTMGTIDEIMNHS